jgi:hypothetical protein
MDHEAPEASHETLQESQARPTRYRKAEVGVLSGDRDRISLGTGSAHALPISPTADRWADP